MHESGSPAAGLVVVIVSVIAVSLYIGAAVRDRKQRSWPGYRIVSWVVGVSAAVVAVIGPVADAAHSSFSAHMVGHVLLGMLSPLLLVMAMPVTLLIRTVSVTTGRRISAVLRSRPVRFIVHPVTAAVLAVGGLWLLYTTELYPLSMRGGWIMWIVHLHVFAAGYLFTAAIIGSDPSAHRASFALRSTVMVAALAGHDILAKYLYAHPPVGVGSREAEAGSVLMYYAGDAVDLAVIVILWTRWYRSRRVRRPIDAVAVTG